MNSHLRACRAVVCVASATALLVVGCSKKQAPAESATPSPSVGTAQKAPAPAAGQETADANMKLPAPFGRHTDDLDAMLKRRNIRALVIINPIDFFYSNGHPMGINYEALRELEKYINDKYKTGTFRVTVSFIPLRADQIEAALMQGVGDVVAYPLIVTPERQQQVAFTVPLRADLKQVIVSGANFGTLGSVDDLSGKEVFVNPLTVAYQNLQGLNDTLKKVGKSPMTINAADKYLLEDDLVQVVSAGLIPATVMRSARAELWSQILPNLTVQKNAVIASGQQAAWAVRTDNPQLKQLLDEFIAPRAVGTSFGNTLLRRYLQNTKWVKDSMSPRRNEEVRDPQLDFQVNMPGSMVDKTLMAFASYNAGPNRIARLRKEAADNGLDPNKWFGNVELMVAQDVGQETVNYVSNIYKYYIAYKLALSGQQGQQKAEQAKVN